MAKGVIEKREFNFWILVLCILIAFLPGIIGGMFSAMNVNSEWFLSINPSISPPGYVFGIVWNVLYLLIGCSLYYVWYSCKDQKDKIKIVIFFGTNFVFNVLWSITFFGLKDVYMAFMIILFILISLVGMIIISSRINKRALYLLIPYLLWIIFATLLNYLSLLKV